MSALQSSPAAHSGPISKIMGSSRPYESHAAAESWSLLSTAGGAGAKRAAPVPPAQPRNAVQKHSGDCITNTQGIKNVRVGGQSVGCNQMWVPKTKFLRQGWRRRKWRCSAVHAQLAVYNLI